MARLPTGPYKTGRTGCYGCKRETSADGSCGVRGYPCIHRGLDMFAESPDIFAPEIGIVIAVSDGKSAPYQGYGPGVILIQGASGYYHLLSHLDLHSIAVRPGSPVFEGQKLATFNREIGHTHYEVRRQPTGPSETNTISPLKWLADQQRVIVAAVEPSQELSPRKILMGVAFVVGLAGASILALKIAKTAAKRPMYTRRPRYAT